MKILQVKYWKRFALAVVLLIGLLGSVWVQRQRVDICIFKEDDLLKRDEGDLLEDLYFFKGNYVFAVSYETNGEGNYIEMVSETEMNAEGNEGVTYVSEILDPSESRVTLNVSFEQDVSNLDIRIGQNQGKVLVSEIVYRNQQNYMDPILLYLWIVLVFGIIVVWMIRLKKHGTSGEENREAVILIMFLTIITTLPYLNDFLIMGHDIKFHLARINGMGQAMKQGQFPIRINPIQSDGYGYASAVMYPQLFLYFPAFLTTLGMSVMNAYKILIFLINLLTSVFSYVSFKNVSKNHYVGLIGCAFYVMGLFRLDDLYIRAAIGEALALAFLPLVFWGMYELLVGDDKKWPIAAIGFSLVIQSHILSTEMYVFLTVVIFIVLLFFLNNRWRRILNIIKAVLCVVIWNLWFIVPFLQYFGEGFEVLGEVDIYLPDRTVYLSQLFTQFTHLEGKGNIPLGTTKGEMPLTLGILPFLAILFGVYVEKLNKEKKLQETEVFTNMKCGRFMAVVAGVLLILILWIIPWDMFGNIAALIRIAETIQFFWRFIGIINFFVVGAVCAMCVVWIHVHKGKDVSFTFICIALALLLGWPAIDATTEIATYPGKEYVERICNGDWAYFYDGDDSTLLKTRGDIVEFQEGVGLQCLNFYKDGCYLEMDLYAEEMSEPSWVEVPLYYYPGYEATIDGNKVVLQRGTEGIIRVNIPTIEQGELKHLIVEFVEPNFWKICNMISILGIMITLFIWLKRRHKHEKN